MANQIQPTDTLETLRTEFNTLVTEAGGTLTIVDDSSTTSTLTTNTDSLTLSGGTGITSVVSGDSVTFNLDNSGVSAASYGSSTAIPVITINAQGQITSASTASISTDLTVIDDASTSATISLATDSFKISGGTGTTSAISGDTLTINLDDTAVSAGSYGSSTAIPVLTVDAQGRLTSASTASISTDLTVIDDSSTSATISLASDSFKIAGGSGITTSISGDVLTVTNDFDLNASELILDADGDTSITADTDDQIDIKVGGTDRFSIASTGKVTVTSTGAASNFDVVGTDAGTLGPDLTLHHNSASPADSDTVGLISFAGNDDGANKTTYVQLRGVATDVTNATEDGRFSLFTMKAGTLTEQLRVEEDGDLHADGNVIAYSTTISDVALKSDIEVIPNALDKLDEIRGVTFTRHNGKQSAGIIAQELEKVLPEAINETELPLQKNDGKKYKTVEYDAIHGLLIQAIKELKKEIQELKS